MIGQKINKKFPLPFDIVMSLLKKELQRMGFEIFSTTDVKETFKECLGLDFKNYTVLSVANLPLSYKSLLKEEFFGIAFHLNIAVFEKADCTIVGSLNPSALAPLIGNESLGDVAEMIEKKFREVLYLLERKTVKIKKGQIQPNPNSFKKAVA